ncbi:hypothetical protein K474DRAFT_1584497, partial [Panus rudis PR-1116 ss-1]
MIFAGDFAQLPPVTGHPLFGDVVASVIHTTGSHKKQEAALGKAIWHQFTTVVILRQNMRQRSQTPKDAAFRQVLENMRYADCTPQDIQVLNSMVVGNSQNQIRLTDLNFRNVSIITRYNSHRDRINELGCERFARESGQTLHTFYSAD